MPPVKPKPTQNLCCVTIDYTSLLLPAEKGIRLVELLRGAIRCERGFNRDRDYQMLDEAEVQYESVKASQVRMRQSADAPEPASPLRLTGRQG